MCRSTTPGEGHLGGAEWKSADLFSDASLNSMRARLRTVALNLLAIFWGGSVRQYRPEATTCEAVGFVQRPVILNDKWDS